MDSDHQMKIVMTRLRDSMSNVINSHCELLLGIWQRCGIDTDHLLNSRVPIITDWVHDLLEDMVRGEADTENDLMEAVRSKLAAAQRLHAELQVELAAAAAGVNAAALATELASLEPERAVAAHKGLLQREKQLNLCTLKLQAMQLRLSLMSALSQMRTLWRRLQIDSSDSGRQYWERLAETKEPTADCLRRMEAELCRLRQLVLPRLRDCIADCRVELAELADRCLAAPSELEAMRPLLESQDWSEDLLDRHEAEAARLRRRFEQNAGFYTCVADWQTAWSSLQTLLQRLKDPAVLNNRGGVLLRLEREKKRAQAALVAKEAELGRLAAARDPASPLTVRGQPIEEFLYCEKQRAEAEKENEAKRRLEKHETTLRRELQFGSKPASPLQRRLIHNSSRLQCKTPATPTVSKTPMRGAAASAAKSAGRLQLLRTPANGHGSSVKKFTPSKLGCSGRVEKRKSGKTAAQATAQKLLRRSLKRVQQQQEAAVSVGDSVVKELPEKQLLQHHLHQHDVSISSSYSAFQSGVGVRSSSVLPPSAIAAAALTSSAGFARPAGSGKLGGPGSQCDSGLSSLANQY